VKTSKPKYCTAITRAGTPCQAAPVTGTNRCLLHTRDNAVLMGMKGGHRRTVFNPEGLVQFRPPESAAQLLPMLAATMCELRGAKLEAKLAQAFSTLANAFLNTLEVSDVEVRLRKLEERMEKTTTR